MHSEAVHNQAHDSWRQQSWCPASGGRASTDEKSLKFHRRCCRWNTMVVPGVAYSPCLSFQLRIQPDQGMEPVVRRFAEEKIL
jgi:hypothetical protein